MTVTRWLRRGQADNFFSQSNIIQLLRDHPVIKDANYARVESGVSPNPRGGHVIPGF